MEQDEGWADLFDALDAEFSEMVGHLGLDGALTVKDVWGNLRGDEQCVTTGEGTVKDGKLVPVDTVLTDEDTLLAE